MTLDLYTKAILSIIALALIAIAIRQYASPPIINAQTGFSGVQFSATPQGDEFFDTRTGELWWYDMNGALAGKHRLVKLGQPLTRP